MQGRDLPSITNRAEPSRVGWRRWTAIVAAMVCGSVLLTTAVARLVSPSRPAQTLEGSSGSTLHVPPEGLNFGRRWMAERFVWTFPVANHGHERVTVHSIAASCSCLSVSPDQFTLEPGESVSLSVTINLAAKARSDGDVALELIPRGVSAGGTPLPPNSWVIRGKAQHFATLDTPLNFGRVSVLEQPLKPLRAVVTTAVPLPEGLDASTTSDFAQVKLTPIPSEGCKYQFELSFSKPLPVGTTAGEITLTPRNGAGAALPITTIPFAANLVPDVGCWPPSVEAGVHTVGESFTQTVRLESLSRRPFRLLSVSARGDGLSVRQVDGEVTITQECRGVGRQSGEVVLRVEAADGCYEVKTDVRYLGYRE